MRLYLSFLTVYTITCLEVDQCKDASSRTKQTCECAVNVIETGSSKLYWKNNALKERCDILWKESLNNFLPCFKDNTERKKGKQSGKRVKHDLDKSKNKTISPTEREYEENLNSVIHELKQLTSRSDTMISKMRQDFQKSMNTTTELLKSDLETLFKETFKSKVFEIQTFISSRLKDISESHQGNQSEIWQVWYEQMNNTFLSAMDEMQTQIRTVEQNIIKMRENEVKDLVTSVSECVNKLDHIEGQALARDTYMMYMSFLVVAVVLVNSFFLWRTLGDRRVDSTPRNFTQASYEQTGGGSDYRLRWNKSMENAICVITFHSDTEEVHVRITRSMFESRGQTSPRIKSQVVLQHSDIAELPGCRVYLVFVDFNDRNVILEDPDKGLGSLRLTTVRSLLHFGGDVTVIYCGDSSSRSLTTDLYNRQLTSVNSQNELRMLRTKDRMLSIYRDFSDAQKQHCRKYINSLIGDRR